MSQNRRQISDHSKNPQYASNSCNCPWCVQYRSVNKNYGRQRNYMDYLPNYNWNFSNSNSNQYSYMFSQAMYQQWLQSLPYQENYMSNIMPNLNMMNMQLNNGFNSNRNYIRPEMQNNVSNQRQVIVVLSDDQQMENPPSLSNINNINNNPINLQTKSQIPYKNNNKQINKKQLNHNLRQIIIPQSKNDNNKQSKLSRNQLNKNQNKQKSEQQQQIPKRIQPPRKKLIQKTDYSKVKDRKKQNQLTKLQKIAKEKNQKKSQTLYKIIKQKNEKQDLKNKKNIKLNLCAEKEKQVKQKEKEAKLKQKQSYFKQREMRLRQDQRQKKQAVKYQQSHGRIRIGKDYQSIIPQYLFNTQELLLWKQQKKHNLLERQIQSTNYI